MFHRVRLYLFASLLVAFFVTLSTTAVAQTGGSCAVDTSTSFNVKICSPAYDTRVPGRFTLSISAHSSGAPITSVWIISYPAAQEFVVNGNQFSKDVTMDFPPQYEYYGIGVQAWNANGVKEEVFTRVWSRKTAGTCSFPATAGINLCAPALTGTVTSPVKVVATTSTDRFVSHMKVYVDGIERYSATDDEVYTYLNLPPGGHTLTVQGWDGFGNILREERSFTVIEREPLCAAMTSPGVQLCQPQENETTDAPLRLTARTQAGSVPITYMRLYRDSQPVWEGEFNRIDTDLHLGPLGIPEGTATFGMVAWNAQGAAFVDTANATVKGYMSPPMCEIPASQTVMICGPGPGDVVPARAIVSARARWAGKTVTAMRIYVDYEDRYTENFYGGHEPIIYKPVDLTPGKHRIVVVAWTQDGDVMVSGERVVTVY